MTRIQDTTGAYSIAFSSAYDVLTFLPPPIEERRLQAWRPAAGVGGGPQHYHQRARKPLSLSVFSVNSSRIPYQFAWDFSLSAFDASRVSLRLYAENEWNEGQYNIEARMAANAGGPKYTANDRFTIPPPMQEVGGWVDIGYSQNFDGQARISEIPEEQWPTDTAYYAPYFQVNGAPEGVSNVYVEIWVNMLKAYRPEVREIQDAEAINREFSEMRIDPRNDKLKWLL